MDFYDPMEPPRPAEITSRPSREWKVTFDGGFFGPGGRQRAGERLPFAAAFDWAGFHWQALGIYRCGQGLVLDLARRVELSALKAFMDKWGVTPESGEEDFPPEQVGQMMAENPTHFDYMPTLVVNRRDVHFKSGCSCGYSPIEGVPQDGEGAWIAAHYGLELSQGWEFSRWSFPTRAGGPASLSLKLEADWRPAYGRPFQVEAGESVPLESPLTGQVHTLTALSLEEKTIEEAVTLDAAFEMPRHFQRLAYTLEPPLPQEEFRLEDIRPSEELRPKDGGKGRFGSSFGIMDDDPLPPAATAAIIGGADGPTALLLAGEGESPSPQVRTALSRPRYQPAGQVDWAPVFRRKPAPPGEFPLEKTE